MPIATRETLVAVGISSSTKTRNTTQQSGRITANVVRSEDRTLLTGKNLVIVALGCDASKIGLYEDIYKTGVNIYVVESPGNELAENMKQASILSGWLEIDLTTRPSLASEIYEKLLELKIEFDGIVTFWDDAVTLCARIQHMAGLQNRGNPIAAIDVAHDKLACRKMLEQLDFKAPANIVIKTEADLSQVHLKCSYPLILKPRFGAASIGVMKVEREDQLLQSYRAVMKSIEIEYSEGSLMGLTFEDASGLAQAAQDDVRSVVAEEYLTGREYDVDIVLQDGEVRYVQAVDNLPLQPPHFCELIELCPPHEASSAQRVTEYAIAVSKAIGLKNGVFHVEVIDDNKIGPCLVELNPRMGGGPMRAIHIAMNNVDLMVEQLLVTCGLARTLQTEMLPTNNFVVSLNNHALFGGLLKCSSEEFPFLLKEGDRVSERINPPGPGTFLRGWNDQNALPTSLGHVIFVIKAVSSYEAVNRAVGYMDAYLEDITGHTVGATWDPGMGYTAWKNHFKKPPNP